MPVLTTYYPHEYSALSGKELEEKKVKEVGRGRFMADDVGGNSWVSLFSWIGVKLGMAELPAGIGFRQVVGVAMLAGVGFTMSIFVANLAFFDQEMLLDSAKTGVL
ncbi:MAG: Na+/H+ antiporter NhaA, partial [Bacteroidetes bacterium]|nr:Na+/H+ antiporter NhaA [Bacteroidota bacterium]